ncbi:glucuronate isomerase [Anaerosolibacter carboniphilus]|uniref:Uronate isomerase n=1 Tax=Anaerosolibacter carboniphilus TaxID=1417629 RepID=A0A841KYW0_9FIRM|nr:glucuronate isomerase [Anaerosolibacter carboniphilus]MBB6215329.1 glucuronate isomerase [Anaerosolibacter carboniphilus]
MNRKFSEELFLTNETGRKLYHTIAKQMPIIDYHCHLQPKEIWENKEFEDIGEMWLAGDHYKWRAMRTFGIDERYITGDASYYEKYMAFAKIFPQLIGNPLYIWCALELKRFFDIDEPLSEANADEIYNRTKILIRQKGMTPRWCMEVSKVELVSTTEDPIDTLEYHKKLQADDTMKVKVLSAFRPDKAMFSEKADFSSYIAKLSNAAQEDIHSFESLLSALEKRLKFFKCIGTNISDNGIPDFTWADYTLEEIEAIFAKALEGERLSSQEINQYRSAFLFEMGRMYKRNGFVMQLHVGTYLDANTSKVAAIGQSTGFDCTDDNTSVKSIGILLDHLTSIDELPKTILYPLDSSKIENFAILAAGFCEGGTRAKVQLGAPWWFNDQVYGIERQFAAAANLYPISLSVGMLTDSRSFLSYPRHELYRRVLCNYLGSLVERGEYFSGEEELKSIVENVCYYNVKDFFGF